MIRAQALTLARGSRALIHEASFDIPPGARVGVVGRNGSGKSSLFAAVAGGLAADSGELVVPAHWVQASVAQHMPQSQETALAYAIEVRNTGPRMLADLEVRERCADPRPTYAEFADDPRFSDGLELARTAQNIIVTRTFSKLHGLAALRIGWAYCPAHIADALDRIRAPFNTSIAAQQAAVASLADEDFQKRSAKHVTYWRPWLTQQLGGLGLDVVPSQANFVLVGFPTAPGRTAREAEAFLAQRGWIVRGVANYGLPDHLRITIGLEDHNRAVIEALTAFMAG